MCSPVKYNFFDLRNIKIAQTFRQITHSIYLHMHFQRQCNNVIKKDLQPTQKYYLFKA